ncbi:ABC transporter ATP-binding protein [Streptomyces sp. DSM 41014]|uniref:ABC transporter ATP-binding protein n=1 Tax=Streptomyces hintoniae TaxID=3075521 RepID=A0ABU2UCZ3_9ACTN|nr:ABC transporter ATP-binding protein [Streptomyces sp. DSM 41014]MDT0471071.1 ABC transporter ATP-binding protein [Streptomyces sp. DSM 41014]
MKPRAGIPAPRDDHGYSDSPTKTLTDSRGRHVWLRVLTLLLQDRGRLIASFTVVLWSVGLSMLGTVLLKRVVDEALPQRDASLLTTLCLVMIAAAVLASVCTVLMARLNHTIGQRLVHRLRVEMFRATQRMRLEHFTTESVSGIQTRIANDVDGISNVVTFAAQGMVASAAVLLTSAVIMLVLSWPIALVSLTLAACLNVLNNRFAKRRRRLTRAQQGLISGMVQFVGEHLSFSGVLLGRTLKRERWQYEKFEALSADVARTAVQERLAGRTAVATISVTLSALPILVYWAAGTVLSGISLGSVIVITALQSNISMPIQQLMQLSSDVQSSRALFERIFEVIDRPDAAMGDSKYGHPAPSGATSGAVRRIVAEGLDHAYEGRQRKSLDGAAFNLHGGGRIFVTGESGSGKSTLALILAGLVDPQAGSVSVTLENGERRSDVRTFVCLVPQEATLFNLSIRENLAFGQAEASAERMAEVLRTVELEALVSRLPRGLDTVVGDRGAKVSGGERQRLAVARALLSEHPVLVFDEFSSGLDSVTSEAVFERLLERISFRTLVVITHCLPTLRDGDVVVKMEAGKVVRVDAIGAGGPQAVPMAK